ncbi:hypothetical protein RRSWK_05773 [Rhodopirellula sp. SWK7]|nr:hypothetical protein RRSWK_05773 [Rhodopirellula sp. SWK7]
MVDAWLEPKFKQIQRSLRRHAATRTDVHSTGLVKLRSQNSNRLNDRRADVQIPGLHSIQ